MSAGGTALANTLVLVKLARMTREPTFSPHLRPEPTNAREGRCRTLSRVVRHALGDSLEGTRPRCPSTDAARCALMQSNEGTRTDNTQRPHTRKASDPRCS